jgi:hypothetical protein
MGPDAYLSTQPTRTEIEKGQLRDVRKARREAVEPSERGWLLR